MSGSTEPFAGLPRSVEDPDLGIRQELLQPELAGHRTVAVLSTPLGPPRSLGWVIVHSLGIEQGYLQPLEVTAARTLAGAGYPALRFHAPGYGDAEGSPLELPGDAHLHSAVDAAALLAERTGVSAVGFLGARFGGSIAALAADRSDAQALAVWQPVVDGARYLRQIFRSSAVDEIFDDVRKGRSARDILAEAGVVGIHAGFPLGTRLADVITAIDLGSDLRRFRGASLVLQVAKGPKPDEPLHRLEARLSELGGRCTADLVADPSADLFGNKRYRMESHRYAKSDFQRALSDALLARTLEWCAGLPEAAAG